MKAQLLTSTAAVTVLLLAQPSGAHAKTIVASIYGSYDAECGSNIDCTLGTGLALVNALTNPSLNYGNNDTPSLFIANPTAYSFTGGTLTATGYQGINNGYTQTISIPTVAPYTILDLTWSDGYAYTAPHTFFNYDYDDSYFTTTYNSACAPEGYGYCSKVGNFDLKFAATWNGMNISSDFSPSPTQDGGNQQGTFVGWEGVDPNGFSESIYDNHSGSTPGVLAYIFTGTTGTNRTSVPEPATMSLLGAGLGALGLARRRRKSK